MGPLPIFPFRDCAPSHHAPCLHLAKLLGSSPSSLTRQQSFVNLFDHNPSLILSVTASEGDFCQQWRPIHLLWLEYAKLLNLFLSQEVCVMKIRILCKSTISSSPYYFKQNYMRRKVLILKKIFPIKWIKRKWYQVKTAGVYS